MVSCSRIWWGTFPKPLHDLSLTFCLPSAVKTTQWKKQNLSRHFICCNNHNWDWKTKKRNKKTKMFCCYKHTYRLVLVTTRQSCSSSYTWLSGTITTCSFRTVRVVYHHVVCACPSWVRKTLYIQCVLSVLQELGHLAARISFLILFYIFFLALSELRGKTDTYLEQCMHHYPQPTTDTPHNRNKMEQKSYSKCFWLRCKGLQAWVTVIVVFGASSEGFTRILSTHSHHMSDITPTFSVRSIQCLSAARRVQAVDSLQHPEPQL